MTLGKWRWSSSSPGRLDRCPDGPRSTSTDQGRKTFVQRTEIGDTSSSPAVWSQRSQRRLCARAARAGTRPCGATTSDAYRLLTELNRKKSVTPTATPMMRSVHSYWGVFYHRPSSSRNESWTLIPFRESIGDISEDGHQLCRRSDLCRLQTGDFLTPWAGNSPLLAQKNPSSFFSFRFAPCLVEQQSTVQPVGHELSLNSCVASTPWA